MKWLRLIIFATVFAAVVLLSFRNTESIQLDLLVAETTVRLPFLFWIALALGVVLGLLGGLWFVVRARRESARLKREIRNAEVEIRNLRSIPIKDAR